MKRIPLPQGRRWDEEIIEVLKRLGSLKVEYPAELLATRRAAFLLQVERQVQGALDDAALADEQFIGHLGTLKSVGADYPADLLAARRTAFVGQIERYKQAHSTEELQSQDRKILRLFGSLKAADPEYPATMLAGRRAAFRRQVALDGRISVLDALRSFVRSSFLSKLRMPSRPVMNTLRTALVVIVLVLAAFAGALLRAPVQSSTASSSRGGVVLPDAGLAATSTTEVARVSCKPGDLPPLCLASAIDKSQDLTYQGNGSARPAVAKDVFSAQGEIHKAAYVNDGRYGPATSWISNSAYSWIKVDLGKDATINTVAFGKDRLDNFTGGDPGQFVIAVALYDNVYADGNSSNDHVEYTQVYDSQQAGFNGIVSGTETILAQFRPVTARYIKITFANPHTAVDELEAFMLQPLAAAGNATRKPRSNGPAVPPTYVSTSLPTSAAAPTDTAVPTSVSTDTPVPADTATPVPTDTLLPTDTPLPVPTDTPLPPVTDTPIPVPTDTALPPATDTPMPAPTDAALPAPTDTPLPPPVANQVQSTDTPVPPPAANLVIPTDSPAPPPAAVQPVDNPTDTPVPLQP